MGRGCGAYIAFMVLSLALILALSSLSCAVSWWGNVGTNSSSWNITRESENISLRFEEASKGEIAPLEITPGGRTIRGYHSRYANMGENDVLIKERTSALEGSLMYSEITELDAYTGNDITRNITKPKGTDEYAFNFWEEWPVLLKSRRYIRYNGSGINDRDFGGNNMDYAGTSLLYNTKLEKDRFYSLYLQRLNITVTAIDAAITHVEFLPLRQIRYEEASYSNGVANLKYGQAGVDQTSMTKGHINYDVWGEQVYHGPHEMRAKLNATTWGIDLNDKSSWLGGTCEACSPVGD